METAHALMVDLKQQAETEHYKEGDDRAYFLRNHAHDSDVRLEILLERAIIRHTLTALLADPAGYMLAVQGTDPKCQELTRDLRALMDGLTGTAQEALTFYRPATAENMGEPLHVGSLRVTYTGKGWDLLAEIAANEGAARALRSAEALAGALEDLL